MTAESFPHGFFWQSPGKRSWTKLAGGWVFAGTDQGVYEKAAFFCFVFHSFPALPASETNGIDRGDSDPEHLVRSAQGLS
jgi:hypothetical protein